MADQIRTLAPEIWKEIQKAKNILFCFHPSPDGDSIGSSLALSQCLEAIGKRTTVIHGDSEFRTSNAGFPGIEKAVPKNFSEIEAGQYDLFLAIDSGSREQISKRGKVTFLEAMKVVNIDHHKSNTKYGHINLVVDAYPAAGQIVYELLNLWGVEITKDAAACLYLALYTDTGGFKYPLTGPETLSAAGKLAEINPEFSKYLFALENSYEQEQIRFLGLALSSIETHFGDKVAIAAVSYQQLQERGIKPQHTEKMEISNILKSAVGWDVGIGLTETEPKKCNVSLRTRDAEKYDLSKLAVALGGGGHKAAAGATVTKPYKEAESFLLKKIAAVYPFLGNP